VVHFADTYIGAVSSVCREIGSSLGYIVSSMRASRGNSGTTAMLTVTVQASKWQLTLGYAAAALWLGYHIMHLVLTI
jgi:hypothetical protein